ncbi:hypothetical protein AHAS_Ahas02G0175700 [Arachis hypogaea]
MDFVYVKHFSTDLLEQHGPIFLFLNFLDRLLKHLKVSLKSAYVLKKCHIAEIVRQDPRFLDALVVENREDWSVGQIRILVLDEATTSIDTATQFNSKDY